MSYQTEEQRETENYKMFNAQGDSGLSQVADLIASKLGESLRAPIKDLGMVIQSMFGLGNKGVQGAMSVLGGLQQYGAPGIAPGGGNGMIGGRDVATTYAAQAVQRDLMSQYTNQVTGQSQYGSRGLNQAQLGQAAGLAFQSGIQYSNGNIFQTQRVTEDFKQQRIQEAGEVFTRTGRMDDLRRAKELKVGGTETTMTATGKETMNKAMDDANALLSTIRDVMGGKALENLEDTMQKLFGGDATKFGLRAARLRMMNVQAISSNYGEGQEGAQKAAAALQASAAVINSGNSAMDQHAALQNERMALAGTNASLVNAGVARGRGYSLPAESHETIAQRTGEQTGRILQEEDEFLYAEAALQYSGGGTEEQKAALKKAYKDMKAAGSDEQKVNSVRADLVALKASTGLTDEMMGPAAEVRKNLNAEAAERMGVGAAEWQAGRNQGLLAETFRTNDRYSEAMGLSRGEAVSAGMGAANMDGMLRGELSGILDIKDDAKRNTELSKFKAKNEGAAGKDFWKVIEGGKVSGRELDIMGNASQAHAETRGFVSKAAQEQQARGEYSRMIQSSIQGQMPDQDMMKKFTDGLLGTRSYSDKEILNKLITGDDFASPERKRVQKFVMDKDMVKGSEGNLKAVKAVLTDKQREELGMPTDDAEARAWMDKDENSRALTKELLAGGMSLIDGTGYAASRESMKWGEEQLSAAGLQNLEEYATGTVGKDDSRNSEEAANMSRERIRSKLNDKDTMKSLIEKGLTGSKESKKVGDLLASDTLSDENRKAFLASIAGEYDAAKTINKDDRKSTDDRTRAAHRMGALKELEANFLSGKGGGASSSTHNGPTTMICNAPITVQQA